MRAYAVLCLSTILFAAVSQAALVDRGSGLIYDTTLNVTWLQNAAAGSGQQYYYQNPWAANFSYYDTVRQQTLTAWRLPSTGEFYSLYHDTLGNPSSTQLDLPHGAAINTGPFTNVATTPYQAYWTYEDAPGGRAYGFAWWSGNAWGWDEGSRLYGWPVLPGDVGAVPEPSSFALAGVLGVLIQRRRARD